MKQRGERGGVQALETDTTEVSQRRLDLVLAILREATAIIDDSDSECIHLQCGSKKRTTRDAMMSSTSRPPKE